MDQRYLTLGSLYGMGDAGDFTVSFSDGTSSTYNTASGLDPSQFPIGGVQGDGTTVTAVSAVQGDTSTASNLNFSGSSSNGPNNLNFGPSGATSTNSSTLSPQTQAGLFSLGTSFVQAGGQVTASALPRLLTPQSMTTAPKTVAPATSSFTTILLLGGLAAGIYFLATRKKG